MTLTRSKSGRTPKKPEHPDFVETPAPRRRSRKSMALDEAESHDEINGNSNGHAKAAIKTPRRSVSRKPRTKVEPEAEHMEFGGPWGVSAMMIGFPCLMWYMWIGATYYEGGWAVPDKGQSLPQFFQHMAHLVYEGAFPSLKAWSIYWSFFIFEAVCYLLMPGIYAVGKPLPHEGGKKLRYYCSAFSSFYLSIAVAATLHFTGIFRLYTLIDEFGPIMSVAIITGFAISIIAYVSALQRGVQHRMTGNHVYDFFMGAELNPRMFNWLDFKMFFEVRMPWFILFFCTAGACARQYEQFGYVTGELGFMLMAHFLYANACCKGEEMIPTTWDIYYEKWGFMLIFWNLAGVPLSYCHSTIYLANHAPSTYHWNKYFLTFMYVSYLFAYWVWDTCASQKNRFRAEQQGTAIDRNTFPQLPWRRIKNPKTIPVKGGPDLFCDGWYLYARKIHYTCDMYFALCWGLITGFRSPYPWFYPAFFAVMITHRATRDLAKCRERYGKSWEEFERRSPYLFIPYVY